MSPDERIKELETQLAALTGLVDGLLEWKAARELQQITVPVDDASKGALGVVTGIGPGSKPLTQNKSISSTPTSITVPAAYSGSRILNVDGENIEVPIL